MRGDDPVLVGESDGDLVQRWQWKRPDPGRLLEFRDLTHPFDWEKKSSLDWVFCEEVATGNRVCFPLDNAVFTIEVS